MTATNDIAALIKASEEEARLRNLVATYRDIFAEITAKAIPVSDPSSDDPERVRHYIVPTGPIHRAAGKIGFQMFGGEELIKRLLAERQ